MKIKIKNPELYIFQFFWIIAIVPKTVQFVIILICTLLYKNQKYHFSKEIYPIILGVAIQVLAVIMQVVHGATDIKRIEAAANTIMMWIFASVAFSECKRKEYTCQDIEKVKRFVIIDWIILIILYIFSIVSNKTSIYFLGMNLALKRTDYLEGGSGARFCALMETPLASSHMFICNIILYFFLNSLKKTEPRNKDRLFDLVICCAFIATCAAHSRIGMLIGGLCLIAYLICGLNKFKLSSRSRKTIIACIVFCGIVASFMLSKNIVDSLLKLFNGRSGSNEARFVVYRLSIQKVLTESPIIGIGVKYLVDGFIPYGSHSTYIGLFYKTGFVGVLAFGCGFVKIIKNIWNNIKYIVSGLNLYCLFLMAVSYFFFLVFADIDGINWVIIMVFSTWGILCNRNLSRGAEGEIN